jgi:hypothetical protein
MSARAPWVRCDGNEPEPYTTEIADVFRAAGIHVVLGTNLFLQSAHGVIVAEDSKGTWHRTSAAFKSAGIPLDAFGSAFQMH